MMKSNSSNFKTPFAYDNGVLVDVKSAVKGKDYVCSCGEVVRLRGGDVISDHFYHSNNSCSYETSIHLAYKEVFKRVKKILIPLDVFEHSDIPMYARRATMLEFDRVELERKVGDFIPDAIGYIGDKPYLIEFAYSSFIGDRKMKKIRRANAFCIELDISNGADSVDEIEDHIVNGLFYKRIIHLPEYHLIDKAAELISRLEYHLENERDLSERRHSRIRELESELSKGNRSINEMLFDRPPAVLMSTRLFHKTTCSTGAEMYSRDDGDKRIVAFAHGRVIDIKIEPCG